MTAEENLIQQAYDLAYTYEATRGSCLQMCSCRHL